MAEQTVNNCDSGVMMESVDLLQHSPITYCSNKYLIAGTDRYLGGAHNPAVVGSTPSPATIG